jgi:hypothetical protein
MMLASLVVERGFETVATKEAIVPFTPPVDDRTDEAVAGEVITPTDELRDNERIIKKGWKVAQQKATEVYNALTIIHTKNLWKLHLDAEGKRKYKSFEKYLFEEFGWDLDRTRALQIIKQQRAALLESGDLTEADMPKERARTAPEVTASKAAQVTTKQFETAMDAFNGRLQNIEFGAGRDALDAIYDELVSVMNGVFAQLQTVIDDEAQRIADEKAEADAAKAAEKAEAEAAKLAASATDGVSPLRQN